MTDLENDPLANDLRAYLSQITAEPMPRDLQDRAVEAPFVRQNRRRVWSGRLGASLLVSAVAAAAAVGLVVHLQRASVNLPPGAAAPTARVSVTPSPPLASTPTASTTPTPHPVDVTAARQAALGLFVADPSTPGHWYPCSNADNWAACPLTPTVKARLADLTSSGYFSDGHGGCGEEYISGTQNGLWNAPKALSAVAGASGSVTVVIQRGPSPPPNLTAVMSIESGTWLASDLASGKGAAASIFAAKPNC